MPRRLAVSSATGCYRVETSDDPARISDCRVESSRCVLPRGDWLRVSRGETLPSIVGNCPVDDGAAVNAFPRVEDEEEIGEPF